MLTRIQPAKSNILNPPVQRARAEQKRKSNSSRLHPLLQLQQTLGNRAVGSLVQARLRIGQPGDRYEQEADRVAQQVLRMPERELDASGVSGRRAWPASEEELQRQRMDEEEEPLQGAGIPNSTSVAPESRTRTHPIPSEGRPLPESVRAFFEPRFGRDFSHVRVHSDDRAARSAGAINAQAFTTGRNIVFGSGQYSPESTSGRKLLAHELTHVVQQGSGVRPSMIQRQGGAPQGAKAKAEAARKEALGQVSEYETNWKSIRDGVAEVADLAPWVARGTTVVSLIRAHTVAALEASEKGDRELYLAYKTALESDVVMYEFIAWHTVVYANLLGLKGDNRRLIESFDADQTQYTGRADAERLARDFQREIDNVPKHASDRLALVRVDIPLVVRKGRTDQVTITVSSAAIEKARPDLVAQTEAMISLQANIQRGVVKINSFLSNATVEGAMYAVDAIQQFLQVRGQGKGKGPKASKSKPPKEAKKTKAQKKKEKKEKKKEEKEKEKEKEKDKRQAAMRFQVQWGTGQGGPTFGLPAVAPWKTGVTTTQAVTTLSAVVTMVRPDEARQAASPAAAKQVQWILSRPPAGIATGGFSKSEYFPYRRYTDARVDVENIRGHNLRT